MTSLNHTTARPSWTLPHGEPSTNIVVQQPMKMAAASLGVQQIVSAFKPAFPHLRVLRDLVIPMPEGCAVRSARIDAVLVCETGVYLFEIKSWRNAFVYRKQADPAPPRWFLRLDGCTKAREIGDPAWQGGHKAARLRNLLPEDLRLQCFVLLPCEGVKLEGAIPAAILTRQDLPYIARLARNNGRRSARPCRVLDTAGIEQTVQRLIDIQGELTVEQHLQDCRERFERAPAPPPEGATR